MERGWFTTMCDCELGSISVVVTLSITTQPTMRQPLSDYIRYIYLHHKTLPGKAAGLASGYPDL